MSDPLGRPISAETFVREPVHLESERPVVRSESVPSLGWGSLPPTANSMRDKIVQAIVRRKVAKVWAQGGNQFLSEDALFAHVWEDDVCYWKSTGYADVDVALRLLMEPTEGMIRAGWVPINNDVPETPKITLQVMIAAVRDEK